MAVVVDEKEMSAMAPSPEAPSPNGLEVGSRLVVHAAGNSRSSVTFWIEREEEGVAVYYISTSIVRMGKLQAPDAPLSPGSPFVYDLFAGHAVERVVGSVHMLTDGADDLADVWSILKGYQPNTACRLCR